MAAASIKSQIIAALLALAAPLKTGEFQFRDVKRVRTLFLLEPMKPMIHLVIGDEHQTLEDDRGYWAQFTTMWKIIVADARDAYSLSDSAEAFLQKQMESDIQLSGLVNKVVYETTLPFTDEVLKPDGGTTLIYTIEYRRFRSDPYKKY